MKIMYISHVDWDWIKQRPQFLAEEMAEKCQLLYVYFKIVGQKFATKNEKNAKIKYKIVYLLPLTRFRGIQKINAFICKIAAKWIANKEKPDVIWTSNYRCTNILGNRIKTVYEVMDLYGEMGASQEEKERILSAERIMVNRADRIVVSSWYIQKKMQEMYNVSKEKFVLIRNGFSSKMKKKTRLVSPQIDAKNLKLAYIGTVASWFDWEKIKYSLEKLPNIEYHIIGPVADKPTVELPCDRVHFHGTVPHEKLPDIVMGMDVLLMPFLVNEIVKAVDPVKLYEYIAFSKDIICVRYTEVERFADFVYFYQTSEEYVDAIKTIEKKPKVKYLPLHAEMFLEKNSWETRAENALTLCEEMMAE